MLWCFLLICITFLTKIKISEHFDTFENGAFICANACVTLSGALPVMFLLAKLLDVDPAATIAVGDSTNDYTMVKAAGLGLAVENAVPELKAAADAVICNYREHSAKYILEHYF